MSSSHVCLLWVLLLLSILSESCTAAIPRFEPLGFGPGLPSLRRSCASTFPFFLPSFSLGSRLG